MAEEVITRSIPDESNKIGIKEGMGYMLGDAGNLFVLTYVSSFLKIFYTDVLKIIPDKVANLFLFTRLWDAINDPMWGAIVAKRKPSKGGKFRPFLLWISIPLALSQFLCFVDISKITSSDKIILVFAYITYIAFGMLYTGMNVPFGSLASVITDDPAGRTLLSTFRTIGGGIGGAAPLLIAPMVIYTKTGELDDAGNAIKVTNGNMMCLFGLAMAVLAVIFYLSCYKTTRERIASEEEPQFNLKDTYLGMLKSKPFVILALTGILISGQLQFASLNQYLYKNYFCNPSLSVLGTVANYLPMALMIPFTPKLVKKFGKKEISMVGSFIAAAASVATYLIKPAEDNPAVYIALLFCVGFGYSTVSITNWAVVSDVIDYQFYKTGIKSESAIYAVYTFCRKLGQTAADYGGLKLLGSYAKYDIQTMNKSVFIPGVSPKILKICTGIPAVTYTIIFILYILFPLTKDKLVPVYEYTQKANREIAEKKERELTES